MQWVLRSLEDISGASDEFILDRFRLRLSGDLLTVEAEEEGENDELLSTARDLAARYIAVLRKHIPVFSSLITFEEFASMPAQSIDIHGATAAERKRLDEGVRQARNELLASDRSCLRQCYDYLQDAREDKKNCLLHLYKFVETLEHVFGGETKVIKALKMKQPIKSLKRFANDPLRNERHAPKAPAKVKRPSADDRVAAMNHACQILHAYEGYVRSTNSRKLNERTGQRGQT